VNRNYRVLSSDSLLHLIREDAEASLCGLPRPSLASDGVFDQLVCPDCIEWLTKRRAASAKMRTVERPADKSPEKD
jgi:hypothetical protein